MSSKSKGKRFENLVADQLEQAGWHIAFKSQYVRFGSIDFDGLWDLIGIRRLEDRFPPGVQWLFVQCKSRKMYGKEKQALTDWKKRYGFAGINCLIAVKVKDGRRTGIRYFEV